MKNLPTILGFVAVSCLAFSVMAAAGGANVLNSDDLSGALFLEMAMQAEVGPKTCDHAHYPPTCQKFHLTEVEEELNGSFRVTLDNGIAYNMIWSGNGVRLESGIVIAPQGVPSAPSGWIQVWPTIEDITLDEWQDVDGNSHLTVSDTVTIGGKQVKVKDAYFFMWLKPVK